MGCSPEQTAGGLKLEGSAHSISHESFYRCIYRPKIRSETLYCYLGRGQGEPGPARLQALARSDEEPALYSPTASGC